MPEVVLLARGSARRQVDHKPLHLCLRLECLRSSAKSAAEPRPGGGNSSRGTANSRAGVYVASPGIIQRTRLTSNSCFNAQMKNFKGVRCQQMRSVGVGDQRDRKIEHNDNFQSASDDAALYVVGEAMH